MKDYTDHLRLAGYVSHKVAAHLGYNRVEVDDLRALGWILLRKRRRSELRGCAIHLYRYMMYDAVREISWVKNVWDKAAKRLHFFTMSSVRERKHEDCPHPLTFESQICIDRDYDDPAVVVEEREAASNMQRQINDMIRHVRPVRSRAMLRRWIHGATLQEIATSYGVSRQRIHQIVAPLVRALKETYGNQPHC